MDGYAGTPIAFKKRKGEHFMARTARKNRGRSSDLIPEVIPIDEFDADLTAAL
jgi:hypothetical protein